MKTNNMTSNLSNLKLIPFGSLGAIKREQGSILLYLIVLMVVFTVIGVGMVSLFGTSVLSIFSPSSSRRAQYLAESGLRYTISEIRYAVSTTSQPETAMNSVDDGTTVGKSFNMPGGLNFNVRIRPLFSYTTPGAGVATSTVTATVPYSGFPSNYAIPMASDGTTNVAMLQVGPNNPALISSTVIAADSKSVTYSLSNSVIIPSGTTPLATLSLPTINASQNNVSKGGTLSLNVNSANAIPQRNGLFTPLDPTSGSLIDSKFFTYQKAQVVGGSVQLQNINWTYAAASFTFPANTYLSFKKAVSLGSTGTQGQGQNSQTDYLTLFSTTTQNTPPQDIIPPALTAGASGFTNSLSALDLSKSTVGGVDRVVVQGYIATGGTHAYWAAFQHLGETGQSFTDPESSPSCDIGYHAVPVNTSISDSLRNIWMQYNQLNYNVHIKMGWDLNLPYANQGLTVRWHENQACIAAVGGTCPTAADPYCCYEGYGISFMRFQGKSCSGDMIPDTVKPGSGSSKSGKLLLVLWEQKINASNVATKDWLAYAELGDPTNYQNPSSTRSPADQDQKVTGNQGWPDGKINDDATIGVRVEDKIVSGVRYTDIKLFYGDASPNTFSSDSRVMESVATNKERARYYPQWLETTGGGSLTPINPQWPSKQFGLSGSKIAYWYNNQTSYDYFTMVNDTPTTPYNTVTLVCNNSPAAGFSNACSQLQSDGATFRTTDFVLDSFPSSRKEIGLFAMGNLYTSSGYPITVAFDDFYILILGGN